MNHIYTEARTQADKIALSTRVHQARLDGYSDQEIAVRLNIRPETVAPWADYYDMNAAKRKPLMTAEAVSEELNRINVWLSRLSDAYDSLQAELRPSEVHKCIQSFEKLSNLRIKLMTMQTAVSSTNAVNGEHLTDEQIENEFQDLLAKLGKGKK